MTLQVLRVQIRALVPYFFFDEITILVHTFWGYSQFGFYTWNLHGDWKKKSINIKKICHSV